MSVDAKGVKHGWWKENGNGLGNRGIGNLVNLRCTVEFLILKPNDSQSPVAENLGIFFMRSVNMLRAHQLVSHRAAVPRLKKRGASNKKI